MTVTQHFANSETPTPARDWVDLNEPSRVDIVTRTLHASPANFLSRVRVVAAKADGQIILNMNNSLPANQRGPFLLDLEAHLKAHIDDALTVWLEPLGDRNSLRNLRGIEVKSS